MKRIDFFVWPRVTNRISIDGIILFLCIGAAPITLRAQNFKSPVEYMNYVNEITNDISKKSLSYISATSHGNSPRKAEQKRQELVSAVYESRTKVTGMGDYEGDKNLQNASIEMLKIYYNILNEDYGKIVDMEEIAEQSYDNMEAYLKAQELASKKLDEASVKHGVSYREFAKKFNVTIQENGQKSEVAMKLEQTGKVNQYYNKLYLLFFKPYKQEFYTIEAMNKKDVSGIEQNRNSLLSYATESLAVLDTMKAFNTDPSLVNHCRKMLQFYVKEAKEKLPVITNYYMTQENFDEMKKNFEKKAADQRTKADVDKYNAAVNEVNKLSVNYEKTNSGLNTERDKLLDGWSQAVQLFMDKHMPHYDDAVEQSNAFILSSANRFFKQHS